MVHSSCDLKFPAIQYLHGFLAYLDSWKDSVDKRPGFDKKEKQMMVLPHETVDGIHMTGMSIPFTSNMCLSWFYISYNSVFILWLCKIHLYHTWCDMFTQL